MIPFQCALCHSSQTMRTVCDSCHADVMDLQLTAHCRQCGVPDVTDVCGDCLQEPPPLDATTIPFVYEKPLDVLIKQFKYGGGWHMAGYLASLLPPPPLADITIPVPLHRRRERQRGFNQARELAKKINSAPTDNHMQRVIDTDVQASIAGRARRQKNVRGAFTADRVRGLSVLLVDDVMTSGATLFEAARTLKAAGAARVNALVIARARI